MPSARIWYDEAFDGYAVSSPYNADFVNWIKFNIPREDRRYDGVAKVWTVAGKHKDKIVAQCRLRFGTVDVTEKFETAAPAGPSLPPGDLAELLRLLGPEAVAKAIRHATLIHHPDRGGDTNTMARINELWGKVKGSL